MRESVQGETVSITLQQSVTAVTSFVLKNGLGSVRVLLSTEILILDSLIFSLDDSATLNSSFDVWAGPNAIPTNALNVFVGRFGTQYTDSVGAPAPFGTNFVEYRHEGLSLPLGSVLKCQPVGSGGVVHFSGTGRIIIASQLPGRQSWTDRLNA